MNYQWYPGHMTKARRMMQENIKLIDLIIEVVDARIPLSSRNPDIDELGKNKARLIIMNKSDLSDEEQNKEWASFFKAKGYYVVVAFEADNACVKEFDRLMRINANVVRFMITRDIIAEEAK